MLATLVDEPFHQAGWVYEEKYDGYRILAYKEGEQITLLSRNDIDRTESFASVAAAVARLAARTVLLDGEVVAFDAHRVSRFQLLQSGRVPLVYAVFDCLYVDGRDLRREPLSVRREALEHAIGGARGLIVSRRLAADGLAAYAAARRSGYEGLVAKDSRAPYVERRTRLWLKVKVHQEEELVIGGYTAPAGSRAHFGALLLGANGKDGLHFVGKVGTGFSGALLTSLWKTFQPLRRTTPPFVERLRDRNVTWLEPKLVAQIAFTEWTDDQKLRHPVFLGLRDDKRPDECLLPKVGSGR
jgi:bifunctional non-homologous end joining protein LigD